MLLYKDEFCKRYDLQSFPNQALTEEYADAGNKQRDVSGEHQLLAFSKEINNRGTRYFIVENPINF